MLVSCCPLHALGPCCLHDACPSGFAPSEWRRCFAESNISPSGHIRATAQAMESFLMVEQLEQLGL